MNIKRNIKAGNYQPHWQARASKKRDDCIAPLCNVTRGIINTALVTPQQASELLDATIIDNTEGEITPLCQLYYKQIHRMLHANDGMYERMKCVTCNANTKGKSRHCPNPAAIEHHFNKYGAVDIHIRDPGSNGFLALHLVGVAYYLKNQGALKAHLQATIHVIVDAQLGEIEAAL